MLLQCSSGSGVLRYDIGLVDHALQDRLLFGGEVFRQ
jgi:hypothetical protein